MNTQSGGLIIPGVQFLWVSVCVGGVYFEGESHRVRETGQLALGCALAPRQGGGSKRQRPSGTRLGRCRSQSG